MDDLVIVGAGGLGREIADYALACGKRLRGFLDDTKSALDDPSCDAPILGRIEGHVPLTDVFYVIALGEPRHRRALARFLAGRGARFATLRHPTAYIASSAVIAEGCIIAPLAFVGPRTQIGAHVLINVQASIGHDIQLGAYSAVAPLAGLGGHVTLGEAVLVGAGAIVTPGRKLGASARLAAGGVLFSDMAEGDEALGNPAKIRPRDDHKRIG